MPALSKTATQIGTLVAFDGFSERLYCWQGNAIAPEAIEVFLAPFISRH
jgi:hypothetical protein